MEASNSSASKDQKSSKRSSLIHKKYLGIPYTLLKCYTPMHQSYLFYLNHNTWRGCQFSNILPTSLGIYVQRKARPGQATYFLSLSALILMALDVTVVKYLFSND